MGEQRREEANAGPYRTPAEIAAEMPRAPKKRKPFPWMSVGGVAAIAQGPVSIGALYDVGSRGSPWMGVLIGLGTLSGFLMFAAFVSIPSWWHR